MKAVFDETVLAVGAYSWLLCGGDEIVALADRCAREGVVRVLEVILHHDGAGAMLRRDRNSFLHNFRASRTTNRELVWPGRGGELLPERPG